jgi:glycosyltransferase involved in cell wall biosynthesis
MSRIELQADHRRDDLPSESTFGRAPRRSHSGRHQDFIVVALPAKDEAERIGACLLALASQTCRPHAVVVLANNCSDGTPALVSGMAPTLPYRLDVECHDFPVQHANAGQARRLAMALSEQRVRPDGILLTTDADAVAAPDWIERNCRAIASGADVVCGRVVLHPSEAAFIPDHLQADDALECRLIELLDRLADWLDPDPTDPLPRHTEAAGASLAVTPATFRRGGGIPALASGEDRAFVRALARIDARIRHDPSVVVSVSARTIGRAPGGMADTIRRRMQRQDEFTDEQVEPAVDAYRRYDFRSRVRRAWQSRSLPPALAIDLGISPHLLDRMLAERYFGSAWVCIEAASPFLMRRRVRFSELQRQIDHALHLLEHNGATDLVCDLSGGAP